MKGLKNLVLKPKFFVDGKEVRNFTGIDDGWVVTCVLDVYYTDIFGEEYRKRFKANAYCGNNDNFDFSIGRRIAFQRAKIEALQWVKHIELKHYNEQSDLLFRVSRVIGREKFFKRKIISKMESGYEECI